MSQLALDSNNVLTLALTDAAGQPVTGATVTATITAPGGTVVATGVVLDEQEAEGAYAAVLESDLPLAESTLYKVRWTATFGGNTVSKTEWVGTEGDWEGGLTSEALMGVWGGRLNVQVYSDKEGADAEDSVAIAFAGKAAESYAQGILSRRFDTPITAASFTTGVVDPQLAYCVTVIALDKLRGGRPEPENSGAVASFNRQLKKAEEWLQGVADGDTDIAGLTDSESKTGGNEVPAPVALYPTVDLDGRAITPSNQRVGPRWDANGQIWRVW